MTKIEILEDVRRRLQALTKEPTVNIRLPRSRSFAELCSSWGRIARCDDARGGPPRTPASVRPAREPYRPYAMADVRRASERNLFTVISLFAGAGGSSVGYRRAGGDVRAVVEFNPRAAKAYRRNSPDCPVVQQSIREVLKGDGVERLLRRLGLKPGEVDWLDASPPCQPFSNAGPGVADDPEHESDHGGVKQADAASLPFDYARFVHRVMPKVSMMENVEGLANRYPEILEKILFRLRFDAAGRRAYFVNWRVISAADHGVGQDRRRVIVISVRADVAERVGIHSDEDVLRVFPRPTHGLVSVRSALDGLEQRFEDERPFLTSLRASRLPGYLRGLPKCPPKVERLKNVKKYYTLARCSWDRPAPTLVIAGQKPDGLSGAIHPESDRKFTVPELKRLFGLPDDFVLTGTIEDAVTCICNMVPPPLTKAVAESVYERVLKPYRELGQDR